MSIFCLSTSLTISFLKILILVSFLIFVDRFVVILGLLTRAVESSYVPFAFDIMRKSLRTINVIKGYDYVLSPIKH